MNVGVWHAETGVAGGANESFWHFVSEGFVTQTGREETSLPFSEKTDNGDKVLMLGMGLKVLPVPVHRMNLDCDLVQGEVPIGVRPELRVEGVDIILGNSLAGSRVWTSGSSLPVLQAQPYESAVRFPEVFPACAVTRVMNRTELKGGSGEYFAMFTRVYFVCVS